jgi:Protein of unknown function (DUF3124)
MSSERKNWKTTFTTMICRRLLIIAFGLASLASCGSEPTGKGRVPGYKARKAVAEVEPIVADRVVAGQTLYVPAYSSIFNSDEAARFNLAVTLSIRNADPNHPIIVSSIRYYDQDGQLVHDYLQKPLRVGPMAATEFFVKESDMSGGVSASFLVEWVADQSVNSPVVESVMIGIATTQGISFTCPGRVLTDRSRIKEVGAEGL